MANSRNRYLSDAYEKMRSLHNEMQDRDKTQDDHDNMQMSTRQFARHLANEVLDHFKTAVNRHSRLNMYDNDITEDDLDIVTIDGAPYVSVKAVIEHDFENERHLQHAIMSADNDYNTRPYHVANMRIKELGLDETGDDDYPSEAEVELLIDPDLYRDRQEGEVNMERDVGEPEPDADTDDSVGDDTNEDTSGAASANDVPTGPESGSASPGSFAAGDPTDGSGNVKPADTSETPPPPSTVPVVPPIGGVTTTATDAEAIKVAQETGGPARAADTGDAPQADYTGHPDEAAVNEAREKAAAAHTVQEVQAENAQRLADAQADAGIGGKVLTEQEAIDKINSGDSEIKTDEPITTSDELLAAADPAVAAAKASVEAPVDAPTQDAQDNNDEKPGTGSTPAPAPENMPGDGSEASVDVATSPSTDPSPAEATDVTVAEEDGQSVPPVPPVVPVGNEPSVQDINDAEAESDSGSEDDDTDDSSDDNEDEKDKPNG